MSDSTDKHATKAPGQATDSFALMFSVAFVWFATHFGGGFAGGAQLYSYFIRYGITCVFFPLISIGIIAFVYWWGWRYAREHELYDYRSFNDSFYGKYAPFFSNAYEFLYIVIILVAPSVAFATGASLLQQVTGIPYLPSSIIIGVSIVAICMFGSNIVRKMSTVLSVIMIVALLAIYIPAIAIHADSISATLGVMTAGGYSDAPLGDAIWWMLLYGIFQTSNVGLFVQHTRSLKSAKSVGKTVAIGFVINVVFFMIAIFGLMSVAMVDDISKVSVPLLNVIDGLPGADVLKIVASVLILLACFSTAVTFISSMVKRLSVRVEGSELVEAAEDRNKPTKWTIVFTLACVVICCCVAQFGLLPLIQKGYGFIGYLAIPIVVIPYVINFIWVKVKGKSIARTDGKAASPEAQTEQTDA